MGTNPKQSVVVRFDSLDADHAVFLIDKHGVALAVLEHDRLKQTEDGGG